MRLLIIFTIGMLFCGCSSKKSTYKFTEHIKFDSINYQIEKITYPRLKETVFVDSPCDSSGQLKPFKQSFITSQGKIIVEGKNNQITTDVNLNETSSTVLKSSKNSVDKSVETSEIKKTNVVQDWRLILLLVLSIFFNIYQFKNNS